MAQTPSPLGGGSGSSSSSSSNVGGDTATLLHTALAFALIGILLVALADTRLYGLAFGIVVVALVWTMLHHTAWVATLSGYVTGAAKAAGGG